jgi:hypothetical protein|tara:strand:- start:205 stop:528 length:324 start_codon:yes stop_codon:yes gene_type:complete
MSKEEIDCEEFPDHEECQCSGDPSDNDDAYDAWADDQVGYFFDHLKEREELYKKLLLCDYHSNNNTERDELEKQLVKNLTGEDGLWLDINSIYGWYQERDTKRERKL